MAVDTLQVFGVEYQGVTGFKAKNNNSTTLSYVRPQGSVQITENGSVDVTNYVDAVVNIPTGIDGNNLEYGLTDGTISLIGVAKIGYAEIQGG